MSLNVFNIRVHTLEASLSHAQQWVGLEREIAANAKETHSPQIRLHHQFSRT
jgi:hypothetical protein